MGGQVCGSTYILEAVQAKYPKYPKYPKYRRRSAETIGTDRRRALCLDGFSRSEYAMSSAHRATEIPASSLFRSVDRMPTSVFVSLSLTSRGHLDYQEEKHLGRRSSSKILSRGRYPTPVPIW